MIKAKLWQISLIGALALHGASCTGGDSSDNNGFDELADLREACTFERGALPEQTLGPSVPKGDEIPIDHWIILMQENRSFDHYFGTMPGVEGFPDDYTNPTEDGTPVLPFHETRLCIEDVSHSWNASHIQYNDGLNDGFVTTNDPDGERGMAYYDGSDLHFYWDLYSTFAMSDHHFCSLLTGTWSNRWYFLSGTSFGMKSNAFIMPEERFGERPYVVMQELDTAGVSWHVYSEQAPFLFTYIPYFMEVLPNTTVGLGDFFAALDDGSLDEVVWIDPAFFASIRDRTDEHPPGIPQIGEQWVEEIIRAVMASEIWPRTAIILTYDEHGGYFDHVPPPPACHPGDRPPDLDDDDQPGDYDRLGFRVPLVVVSPYSRPGYISDITTDLTSVLRLIQTRYNLPAMTGRDANAWPLLDMFDFDNAAFMTPPELDSTVLPDDSIITACDEEFPE
jgi:phospholipase C